MSCYSIGYTIFDIRLGQGIHFEANTRESIATGWLYVVDTELPSISLIPHKLWGYVALVSAEFESL